MNMNRPLTGVVSQHTLDLDCLCSEKDKDCIESDHQDETEFYECDSPTLLLGDWLKNENDEYYPDPKGEYAAIWNNTVIQVVYSIFTKKVKSLCSPCYPNQGDLDSGEGTILCYDMPDEFYPSLDNSDNLRR